MCDYGSLIGIWKWSTHTALWTLLLPVLLPGWSRFSNVNIAIVQLVGPRGQAEGSAYRLEGTGLGGHAALHPRGHRHGRHEQRVCFLLAVVEKTIPDTPGQR